jgi:hypothetical protein
VHLHQVKTHYGVQRERERERERVGGREREGERVRERERETTIIVLFYSMMNVKDEVLLSGKS